MVPLAPNTVTITRPDGDGDPYEAAATAPTIAAALRVALTRPSGADLAIGGDKEVVDAVMVAPTTPVLQRIDIVVDDDTDETYRVTWVRTRRGLGLDHQVAGLRAVKGGASG